MLSHLRVGEHGVLGLHISMATTSSCCHEDQIVRITVPMVVTSLLYIFWVMSPPCGVMSLVCYYMTDVGAPCVSEYVGCGEL